ncbi:MAG: vitamin K epoxide reductase family protein [Parcubacteria group bacterium]|nr:vitamin K epoxide reductase family protein [Parcubacteria group bacterium]
MFLPFFIFIASFIGLADSVYLTIEHYRGVAAFCLVTAGCDKVLTSAYSEIVGIPLALLGVVFYSVALIAAAYFFYRAKNVRVLAAAFLLALGGFLFSVYSVYLQIAVIKAFCFYCLVSVSAATFIFVLWSLVLVKKIFYRENSVSPRDLV